MKKLISFTLLVVIGVAGSLIYTSKPEAKAGFTSKSFRIILRDGGDSLRGYFGTFGYEGIGKAAGPNTDPEQNHLFDNWQGSLIIHFGATLKGPGPAQLYPISIYAGGYDYMGHSDIENLTGAQVKYDVDWFRLARNLSITNYEEVPILKTTNFWHGMGYVYELDPYNPTDPDPNNLYWVAEEAGNSKNIDINIAIYPVMKQGPVNYRYTRLAIPLS